MKALILAGGLGTRLGTLTRNTPKPLLTVRNEPLINSIILFLKRYRISEIGIIIHEDNVVAFRQWEKEFSDAFGVPIQFFVEKNRAGTFGCLRLAKSWIGDETFFTLNGDCLMDFDVQEVLKHHQSTKSMVTLALVHPMQGGNFVVPEIQNGWVKKFERKMVSPFSEFICSGFQVVEPGIFDHDTNEKYVMMEDDILTALSAKNMVSGLQLDQSRFIDCGTVESLAFARKSW